MTCCKILLVLACAITVAFWAPCGFAAQQPHGGDPSPHGGDHGSANPLTVDPDLPIVTAIIFVVLLLVLWKFAWGPIVAGLDKREKRIADSIDEARQTAEEAKKQLADYEAKLASAADEVRQIVEQGRRDAESDRQRIVNEARQAAAEERDRAVREIGQAKKQALHELWQESVDRAFDLAGQVVRKELKPDDHARLITESMEKFPSQN